MAAVRTLRVLLVPLLLLTAASRTSCELSTDSSGRFELRIVGEVHLVADGCWQLEAVDGRRYELQDDQAPEAILRDGARVNLLGFPRDDREASCGLGTPLEVRRVYSVS